MASLQKPVEAFNNLLAGGISQDLVTTEDLASMAQGRPFALLPGGHAAREPYRASLLQLDKYGSRFAGICGSIAKKKLGEQLQNIASREFKNHETTLPDELGFSISQIVCTPMREKNNLCDIDTSIPNGTKENYMLRDPFILSLAAIGILAAVRFVSGPLENGWLALLLVLIATLPWVGTLGQSRISSRWRFGSFSAIALVVALALFVNKVELSSMSIVIGSALLILCVSKELSSMKISQQVATACAISGVAVALACLEYTHSEETRVYVLLGIAALPWLTGVVSELEFFGAKLKLAQVTQRVDQLAGATSSLETQIGLVQPSLPVANAFAQTENRGIAELDKLANDYVRRRESMGPGPARTQAMTAIVRRMIDVKSVLTDDELDKRLTNDNQGKRLTAYVYLFSNPDSKYLARLTDSIAWPGSKPFGQYWGIKALQRMTANEADGPPADLILRWQDLLSKLTPGTDRHYELSRLISGSNYGSHTEGS